MQTRRFNSKFATKYGKITAKHIENTEKNIKKTAKDSKNVEDFVKITAKYKKIQQNATTSRQNTRKKYSEIHEHHGKIKNTAKY